MATEGNEGVTDDPTKFAIEFSEREELLLQGIDPDVGKVDAKEDEPDDEDLEDPADPPADPPANSGEEEEQDDEEDDVPQHWASQADRELAEAYGLTDADVDQMSSREEFVRLAAALARQNKTAKPAEKTEEETSQEVDDSEPLTADGKVNVAYYKANDYDDGYVKAMEALRKQQDAADEDRKYLQDMRAQQQQAEQARFMDEFMDAADELNPEFYGKSLNDDGTPRRLSKEQAQRRQQLFQAAEAVSSYQNAISASQGRPAPRMVWKDLASMAHSLAHPEQAKAETSKQRTEAIKAQSQRRRPVASSAGATGARKSKSDSDDPAVIANDPEVVAAWERAQAP